MPAARPPRGALRRGEGRGRDAPFSDRRDLAELVHTGGGAVPPLFFKGRVCEAMGWTFRDFDEQPADEVLQYWALRALCDEMMAERAKARAALDEDE